MKTRHVDEVAERLGLTFRLAENNEEDATRFCGLFNSVHGRNIDRDYFRWQFFDTPFPSVLAMATTEDEEPAGFYGFHVLESDAQDMRVAWALDIIVAPGFQGKGVFRALEEYGEVQLSPYKPTALCVMANQRADGAHVNGLGWSRINVLERYVCPTLRSGSYPGRLDFSLCDSFDESALELISTQRDLALFSNLRSKAFLDWRFVSNPWHQYEIFIALDDGQPFGYLVLKVFHDPRNGLTSGDIVDVSWAKDDPAALGQMLRFALDGFQARGVSEATMWLQTNTIMDWVGREVGFGAPEPRRYFCCKVLDERYRQLEDPKRWFVTMADAETY